ncbi:PspA/IM30 family protein [Niabella ginsengisoli]|uniref:PspA/IM30 family protein n=1 Tax=Niabella ginsengisoli TaxID=522298 RepID=A0ABS9SEZ5_9BACT|nr:PspA/IM30 family protein [Niabella ginsengisoli]MCH5596905.1 PspA/IM30 family protein [Niabella ginsengisoli]
MNIFKRLFRIGQAETHSAIDKLEDPIKMIEQGLRDLHTELDQANRALAEVKAMHIRRGNELKQYKEDEGAVHNKSILLLKKAQEGAMESNEADTLVKENLRKKAAISKKISITEQEANALQTQVTGLEGNVTKIKSSIGQWESELKTLRARVKVSNATQKINQQLMKMDSNSVAHMLERMKDKVLDEEALATAYGEMNKQEESHEEKVNKLIDDFSAEDELAKLKNQLGIENKSEPNVENDNTNPS